MRSDRPSPMPVPSTGASERSEEDSAAAPFRWKTNVVLFLLTVVSVFFMGAIYADQVPAGAQGWALVRALPHGWPFAAPLLTILLFHEFGHYFAARYHRVDASLPFFIPFPLLSPFGTMGAVISMRGRIKSKNALLDIGASGPLAGLLIAIPVLWVGLTQSTVGPITGPGIQEGQSLFYWAIKRLVLGPMPAGHDVFLSPVAFAGWSGLFVTALNLIPFGQLDGGHIAYSLFGPKQNRYAKFIHYGMLGMFGYNLAHFVLPALSTPGGQVGQALSNSMFWLFWFFLLIIMKRVSGSEHPPTEPGALSQGRRAIAVLSLLLFVLLFMPTPWSTY